jgi:hypothetical protein
MRWLSVVLMCCFITLSSGRVAGQDSGEPAAGKLSDSIYVIQKFDGDVYVGRIIDQDPRMIQLAIGRHGMITIRRNDIEVIKATNRKELKLLGDYTPAEVFSTRYFVNSSSLPVKKHENYVQWNWYGPDVHYAVLDNFDVEVNTSWVGFPMIANLRYILPVTDKLNFGAGALLGWGSWPYSDCSGAFSYLSCTYGNRKSNFTVTGGYGMLSFYGQPEQHFIFSGAGQTKIGKTTSLIFDSFVLPPSTAGSAGVAAFIPGIRFQPDARSAFQLGFGGLFLNWTFVPAPLPFVQWYRRI